MDQELKAKWVAALRSGQYKQQRNGYMYCESTGYCCLGVLAQVGGLMLNTDGKPRAAGHLCDHYDLLSKEKQQTLWRMNDGGLDFKPQSFAEIADYIEKNL